jgi:hypothetical protein
MLSIEQLENIVQVENIVEELENIAELECTCSLNQQTSVDPTVCKSCQAAKVLNSISEIVKFELEVIKKDES